MKPHEIRRLAEQTRKLGEEIEQLVHDRQALDAQFKAIGINHDEYMAFLNYAGEPALWEEDR